LKCVSGKKLEAVRKENEEWIAGGMTTGNLETINQDMNYPYDPDLHDFGDVVEWLRWFQNSLEDQSYRISKEVYRIWSKAKYGFENIFWDVQGYHNSDYTEHFVSFTVSASKDMDFEVFEKQLLSLVDNHEWSFRQEVEGYEGLSIQLMTDDCSASGIPFLLMLDRENDEWLLAKTTYGSSYVECGPKSLKEVFDYMVRNGYTYE